MKNQSKKITVIALLMGQLLSGCHFLGKSPGAADANALFSGVVGDDGILITGNGTAGVRNFAQIRESMSAVTGVDDTTNTAITSFYDTQAKSVMSLEGRADAVSPAMLLAVTGMAGLFCKQLIANDQALPAGSRRAHQAVDFAKNQSGLTDPVRRAVIQKYAELFWRRSPTETEIMALSTAIDGALAGRPSSTTETVNALLVTCTAALSSLDFIQI